MKCGESYTFCVHENDVIVENVKSSLATPKIVHHLEAEVNNNTHGYNRDKTMIITYLVRLLLTLNEFTMKDNQHPSEFIDFR